MLSLLWAYEPILDVHWGFRVELCAVISWFDFKRMELPSNPHFPSTHMKENNAGVAFFKWIKTLKACNRVNAYNKHDDWGIGREIRCFMYECFCAR